jgi:hypothetical protein
MIGWGVVGGVPTVAHIVRVRGEQDGRFELAGMLVVVVDSRREFSQPPQSSHAKFAKFGKFGTQVRLSMLVGHARADGCVAAGAPADGSRHGVCNRGSVGGDDRWGCPWRVIDCGRVQLGCCGLVDGRVGLVWGGGSAPGAVGVVGVASAWASGRCLTVRGCG